MSKTLYEHNGLVFGRFHGGKERGPCYQITVNGEYCQLTREEFLRFLYVLNDSIASPLVPRDLQVLARGLWLLMNTLESTDKLEWYSWEWRDEFETIMARLGGAEPSRLAEEE